MNTWIVAVNYNGWADSRKCLQSLTQLSSPASVVLVDNASRERKLAELQADFPQFDYVQNDVNGGWAGGNNVGIRHALRNGAEQIILLNNDTTVAPHLVSRLLETAADHPEYGIIGPIINYMDEPTEVMTDGTLFNPPDYNGFFLRKEVPLRTAHLAEVEIVNGCCMMVSAKVLSKIGLIDERFFLIHEESDFCLRAREAGFKCGVLGESLIWHKGSSTFKSTGSRIQRYYDSRNLYLLLQKHYETHDTGRGWFRSLKQYLKYVYYRYSAEREEGNRDAANAVLEGMCDALVGRYGPAQPQRRWGVPVLRGLFEVMRRVKS